MARSVSPACLAGVALAACSALLACVDPYPAPPPAPVFAPPAAAPGTATSLVAADPARGQRAVVRPELDDFEWAALDPRKTRLQQRATALLVTELQGLEQLLAVAPRPSRDRPAIVRRLAEDYVELEHGAERERAGAEGQHQDGIACQKGMVAAAARRAAIKYYAALTADYATEPRLDEAFYGLALEYAQAGDDAQARNALRELVASAPGSRLVPSAMFLEGWLLSIEAVADPAMYRPAEEAFAKAAGSSDAPLAPVALRRLAWVARLAGDSTAADEAARRLTTTYPTSEAAIRPVGAPSPGPASTP